MDTQTSKKWWIFIGCSLMVFLVNVDGTIVNLALAKIAHNLNAGLTQIQWVVNAYLLTTAIFFIVGGKLADIFTHKRIFLIGVVFFGAASFLAGIAPNFTLLIIARLLQGIGFAFTLGLALVLITHAFPANQKGLAVGLTITITGLGQALGPTMGGIILEDLNWHWIFLINVPFAVLSFLMISLFLKTAVVGKAGQSIDYSGILLFGVFVTVLLLTFNTLTSSAFHISTFYVGLVISVVLLIIFFWKEMRTRFPLIDFKLFLNKDYALTISMRFLFMYVYGTFLFFIPLYLQNMLGYSPLVAGLIILIYSAMIGIASPMAGLWCDNAGYRSPITAAAILAAVAFFILSLVYWHTQIYLLLMGMVCFGLSAGIFIPSTVNSTISSVPKESSGEGIGMFFTMAFIGMSLGVAVGGSILHLVSAHVLATHAVTLQVLQPSVMQIAHRVANGTYSLLKLKAMLVHMPMNMNAILRLIQGGFLRGLTTVMGINVVLAMIITILSFCLNKRTDLIHK